MASAADVAVIQATNFSWVAALTWLVWDWALAGSDEVHLIWHRHNGWFRWLYVFIRYVPMVGAFTIFTTLSSPTEQPRVPWKMCDLTTTIESVFLGCVIVSVEIILLLRVYVLYDRQRKVLIFLLALCAASIVSAAVTMSFASDHIEYNQWCLVTSSSQTMLAVWLPPAAFETILFVMTMKVFGQSRRDGLGKRPILDTIVRDGTWAYALSIIAVTAPNALIYTRFAKALSGIAYFWSLSVLSFVGSHVLLNLRRLGTAPCWLQDRQSALPVASDDISMDIPCIYSP
ncbi:hypothetical protein C8Q80DRAFT_806462 [Daedaleopsis nitida]|nr:hypothetical protein C8Q80DRAFT_806462 [Daedaleopsis nitida]